MKKQSSFFSTVFAAGFILVASALNVSAAQITAENAKSIALENANIDQKDITLIHVETDLENGRSIFDVEFITKSYEEYDYEILAETGEILGINYKKKAFSSNGTASGNAAVTIEQAKEIAITHAGAAADQITFIKEKTDFDDGRQIYELEFYTSTYQEYEYDIDVQSGTIISWDFDSDSSYARQAIARQSGQTTPATTSGRAASADRTNSVSLESAKATALNTAGLTNEQVTWGRVYKEYDDGRLIYKGKFFYNSFEYEFEIDTVSGAIIDWDVESIFD